MSKVLISESTLQNMANAIRQKTGTSESMTPSEMVTEVGSIYIGSDTRDANATAKDIKLSKTAYVNEVKLTGSHDVDKDLNTNIFKTLTVNADQSTLANYYVTALTDGTLLNAKFQAIIGYMSTLDLNGIPKQFTIVAPNTAPHLMLVMISDGSQYLYFDTNYTAGFIQFDAAAGTGYVDEFLQATGLSQAQLEALSGWYDVSTLTSITNPPTLNSIIITEVFESTVGDYVQNAPNIHYVDTKLNIDDSMFNISYTKFNGTTENTDITTLIDKICNNDYMSDANITASDVVSGKIGYTLTGKVTGNVPTYTGYYTMPAAQIENYSSASQVNFSMGSGKLYFKNGGAIYSSYSNLATALGITADKIVSGNTILDIQGTGGGGSDVVIDGTIKFKSNTFTTLPNWLESATFTGSMEEKFASCTSLTSANLTNVSGVTSTKNVFNGCTALTSASLNASNATTYLGAFRGCSHLTSANVSLNTSNATIFENLFYGCSLIDNNIFAKLNLTKAVNLQYTFCNCTGITAISNFDTSNVQQMSGIFSGCTNLTTVPVLDTSNLRNYSLQNAFASCSNLTNESLNNILLMCTNATRYGSGGKTLKYMGLTSAQATICTGLSNYANFIAAGWTTGY